MKFSHNFRSFKIDGKKLFMHQLETQKSQGLFRWMSQFLILTDNLFKNFYALFLRFFLLRSARNARFFVNEVSNVAFFFEGAKVSVWRSDTMDFLITWFWVYRVIEGDLFPGKLLWNLFGQFIWAPKHSKNFDPCKPRFPTNRNKPLIFKKHAKIQFFATFYILILLWFFFTWIL
jgi:hypothetical protein